MEGSKAFAKDFMARHDIPTARYRNFSDYAEARQYLDNVSYNVVLKATGLAAGKGVILPSSKKEAYEGLKNIMINKEFGSSGDEVVIEEYLEGEELSFLTFSDGHTIKSLPPAQDHKRIDDGDKGPNTGGMGAYAPTKVATPKLIEEVHRTILQPTIDGMRKERFPFVGLLFTGLMVTKDGPKTLEYNVRFGDPETQTLLPLMDGDLADVMFACTDGCLDSVNFEHFPLYSATIVAAAGGYPGPYVRGDTITLSPPPTDTHIFHAGTKAPTPQNEDVGAHSPLQPLHAHGNHSHGSRDTSSSQNLTTSGGRVIAATSTGKTLEAAISQAYEGISSIRFPNMHFRRDIGKRSLEAASNHTSSSNGISLTYESVGVSISAGNSLVKRITPLVASTARPGASAEIGGFGGVFDLYEAGYKTAPQLVSGTDGVGTKLKIAQAIDKHDTIGIDLCAMNVNDLVVQGAEPLFFTDTYTCSTLDVDVAEQVIKGICTGCREANCALIGGETAEMPGLFTNATEYDIVGATTGAIARGKKILPDKEAMVVGDVLLGLASNGCHSNGFSLIRKVVERAGLSYHDRAPWSADDESLGQSLLAPTRIYVRPLLQVVRKDLVKGLAHITGGGLIENVPRMLPRQLAAEFDAEKWPVPKVLRWLKNQGSIENMEFGRVWNTGLGMVLVVSQERAQETIDELKSAGETVYIVGKLCAREGGEGCIINNISSWD